MIFAFAEPADQQAIAELLTSCNLPANDLEEHLDHFIVAKERDRVIGCIGFEARGLLLRSLAVSSDFRRKGIANRLCEKLLDHAREEGASVIYLLTDTASDFFSKRGFERMPRNEAPETIRNHKQFTQLCPSTAILMWRRL
jgi:amino-acid N-acetyltransferase